MGGDVKGMIGAVDVVVVDEMRSALTQLYSS